MSERKPRGYWTLERCIEKASLYGSVSEWKSSDNASYVAAVKHGYLPRIKTACPSLRIGCDGPKGVTKEECRRSASQFRSRRDWEINDLSYYRRAVRCGWLEFCCAHMKPVKNKKANYWTKERCIQRASEFATRKEWNRGCEGSYRRAVRQGWMEDCCGHMQISHGGSDANVVYLWRDSVSGIYKVGITSDRMGEERISICTSVNGMEPEIVMMLKVPDARSVEKEILKLGTAPSSKNKKDGYTEMRQLSDLEVGKAVSIAYRASIAA